MKSSTRILIQAAVLGILGGVGYELGRQCARAGNQPAGLQADVRRWVEENAQWDEANGKLRKELEHELIARARSEAERKRQEQLALLRTAVEVNAKGWANVGMTVQGLGEKLQPGFIRAFDLSREEIRQLELALSRASRRHGELTAAAASVKRPSADQVVITVPPLADGPKVYDRLMEDFAHTLGPERMELLFALKGDSFDSFSIGQFGAEERVITLTRKTSMEGRPIYVWKDQHRGSNSSIRAERFSEGLSSLDQPAYQWVRSLIPSDFEQSH